MPKRRPHSGFAPWVGKAVSADRTIRFGEAADIESGTLTVRELVRAPH